MQKYLRKLLSLLLVFAMVVGYIPAMLNVSAASATEDTEAASDMLASASYVSGNVSWNGNGVYTYDNKSTATNGADSLYSWRFSRTTADGYTYPDMRIDLGNSYDLTNQDLVFDIKADPAEELTAYSVNIALYDADAVQISQNYYLYFTGEGWHTLNMENSAMQAFLISGKSLSDVQYINIQFTLPAGDAQNIYIDNMHLSERPIATDTMDSAADMLADANVVNNVANGTTMFYEHDCTAVSYGENSNTSHKFSAAVGEDETLTVKYDLGKSYDLTNKDIVLDMLSYNAGNNFLINLYDSSNKLVSYTSSYTTRGQWTSVTPAILNGLQPGMNLSDVRYISIGARFNTYTNVADRTFYVDNMRLADIDVHYTPLQNKNIVFMGDSITAAVGYKGWSGELQEHYGINRYNLGVGGTSYSNVEDRTPIYNQLQGIPSDVNVDFFVLNGGVNDIWSAIDDLGTVSSIPVSSATVEDFNFETTASGMEKVFCYLRTNYPNAKIAFVINYICYTGDFDGVRFRDEFAPLAKAICEKWDVPYLDLANNEEFNAKFNAVYGVHTYDGVHGNDHGFELVMRELAPWLIDMCEGTEQTEQDTDHLAYATVSSSNGDFTYSNTCTDTYGSGSIRSWKFSATASQSENASALLYLQNLNIFDLSGKALEMDVKFEGGAQKLGIQFYDGNWKALTDTVWANGNGADGWQTITMDAAVFESALKSGMSLNGVNFLNFTFNFADNAGNAQDVYIDNLRIVNDNATEETEAASDLLYGASYVEGYFSTPGFGYDLQNTSYVNGANSKYSLRFFAADDKIAWTTATFKLPRTIDLTKNSLKFDVNQRGHKAVSVALYDNDYKLVTSDDFSLKDTGWQTFEVNSLYGLASGRTSDDLADIAYIKFSFSFETASVGRTIIIDNLSIYENEQYATMISGMHGLYLGDSISEAISYKGWAGELAEHYGVTGLNVSASGAVVINNQTHNIHQQLNKVPDGSDFDFVLLNGGVNDVWKGHELGAVSPEGTTEFNVDTTIGALEDLFSRLKAAYPNSEICYILNYVCVQAGYPSDTFRNEFAPLAREACAKWGIHCLDLVDNDTFNAEFDASAGVHTYDGVHPNTEGYVVLTKYIATWLEEVMCVDAKVRYQQLSLSDDLTMRFDLLVSDTYKETATVTVTVGGEVVKEVSFSGLSDGTTGCKRVEVALAAAQMTDDIVVTIANDGTVLFEETYSIQKYTQYLLDGDYNSKTQNLANAVLNYGANAQLYFGHNTDKLANAGLTAPETVEIPEINTENMISGSVSGISFYGASLVYVSKVAVRFYFNVNSDISNFTFSAGNEPVFKDGLYYVEIPGINPQEYAKDIALTVSNGAEEMTVTYSPMYYLSRMYIKTGNEVLKNLLASMYQYHLAAVKYVAEDVVRGDYFSAGESITVDVVNSDKLSSISFDYKITEGSTFAVSLCTDWSNYYGYYTFNAKGSDKTYNGVTSTRLEDDYIRVTFDVAALTDFGNTPNGIIDFVYIRGGWSDAAGYIDAITFVVDDGTGDDGGDEVTDRGEAFELGVDKIIELDNTDVQKKLSFDYKITSGTQFHLALMEDWSNFYSYYILTPTGPRDAYEGVTYETLSDGYIRVTFEIAALDKINGNPTGAIQFLYIRGGWSDSSGYIDNICFGDDVQDPEPENPGAVFEGGSFTAGTDLTIVMDNQNAVTNLSFDYQVTSGGTFAIALLPDWSSYYGYFNFNVNGASGVYDGVTTEKLSNGYIRVYVDLDAVTAVVGAPSNVLTMLYIRGGWSDANGTLTNICLNSTAQEAPRGEAFVGGEGKTIELGNSQALSSISFEYKIVSGNQIAMVLMPDWNSFYGYFELDAEGSNAYDGVSYEKLDDGYIRVTFDMAALTKMSGTPSTAISFIYIRGDWTDASGYIDNVQFTTDEVEPKPTEPDVPAGEESVAEDWINMKVDSGISTATASMSSQYTANGSSRSMKIVTSAGDVGTVYLDASSALSSGEIEKLPDFSSGKITAWFYFGDQRPMAFLRGIDANWNKGVTGIFTLTDNGNGWYYGELAASELGFEVRATNTKIDEIIRIAVEVPGGYTVYVDDLKWENISVTEDVEKANDLLSVSTVVADASNIAAENSTDMVSGLNSLYSKIFTAKAGVAEQKSIRYELPMSYDMTSQALSFDVHRYDVDKTYGVMMVSLQDSNGNTVVDALVDNMYWLNWNHIEVDIYKYLEDGKSLRDVKYVTFTFYFDRHTEYDREIYLDNMAITPYETYESVLNGTSALYIGDSISISKPFKGWAGLLEERYGVDRTNVSVGGTTFSTIGTQIKNQLKNVPEDAEFDYIILDGGINDLYLSCPNLGQVSDLPVTAAPSKFDDSTAIGAFEQLLSMLKRRYPNAKIGYVITYQRIDNWVNEFVPEVKKACDKWGVSYLCLPETYEFMQLFNGNTGAHTTDTVHANVAGYELIMEHLPQWMESIPEPEIIEDFEPEKGKEVFEGAEFVAGTGATITMDNQASVTKLSFDYKIDSGYFHIALLPDWNNFYGYFKFDVNGASNTYSGITTENLDNGYIRVYVDIPTVTTVTGTPSDVLTMLFIRGNWTTANGDITNICLNSSVQEAHRGEGFVGGESKTVELGNSQALSSISFEYKIVSGNQIAMVLMPDWNSFYGYFELDAEGSNAYDGVSYEKLDDGYIRVTFDMAALTKMSGTPSTAISFIYIRGDWTDASGYIDNIQFSTGAVDPEPEEPTEPEVTEPEVTEPEVTGRGSRFLSGEGINVDLGQGTFSTVTMEYAITNDGTFAMAVCGSWNDFYGYYEFDKNGTVGNYAGITCEKLSDGYIRVTFDVDALNATYGAPTNHLKFLYISGSKNTADGYIDQVSVVDYREEVIRGEEFKSGVNWSMDAQTEDTYGAVTFDYKITDDGTIAVALLNSAWDKYYGYFVFDENGATRQYNGVTTTKRSDGYIYVTFDVDALTTISSTGEPEAIGAIRIRGSASTANGYIDNVQFKESLNPTGVRFGVLSDVHLGNDDTYWASNHLKNALTAYKMQGVDAIVMTGDLQNHYKEPYTVEDCKMWMENLADVWFEVFPNGINDLTGEPVEPILIYGNHDQLLVAEEYWPSRFGEYTDAYLKEVNGYYFVGAQYQKEFAAAQLLDYAEENSNGYPFFYMQHCPMIDILYGEDLEATDFETGMTMRDDLWNVSNAITFSGHTHLPATDERSIYQPSDSNDAQFTAIQVPSLNYARLSDLGYAVPGDASASKQGLYVVVEGSQVSVSRLSFADSNYPTGEKLGADWSFDAADSNDKPYGYETRANTVQPTFSEDAQINVLANSGNAVTFSFPAATVTVPEGFSDQIQSYYIEVVNKATGETAFTQDFVTNYFIDAKPENFAGPYTVTANGLEEGVTYLIRVYAREFYQVSSEPLAMEITTAEAVIRGQEIVAGESYSIGTNITEPIASVSFEYKIVSGEKFNIAVLPDWNNFFGYVTCYASGYLGSDPGVSYQVLPDGYIRVTLDLTKMTTMYGNPTNVIELLYIRGSWSDANGYIDNIQYVTGEELPDVTEPEVTEPEVTEPEVTEPEVTEPVIRGKAFNAGANSYIYTECTDNLSQFSFEYRITNDGIMDVLIGNDNGQYGNFYLGVSGTVTSLTDATAKNYAGVTTEALNDGYIRITFQLDELTTLYRGTPGLVISYIRIRATSTASGYVDNVQWNGAQTDVVRGETFTAGSSKRIFFTEGVYNTVIFDYKITDGSEVQFALLQDSAGSAYYGRFILTATGEKTDYAGVEVTALSDGYYRVTVNIAEVTESNGIPTVLSTFYIRGSGTTASGYVDLDESNFT